MNAAINLKLDRIRKELAEAMNTETPYSEYLLKADESFLKQAAKGVQALVGKKADVTVEHVGTAMFLVAKGVDKSDIEFTMAMSVAPKNHASNTDSTVYVDWQGGVRGKISDQFRFRISELTPAQIVRVFSNFW